MFCFQIFELQNPPQVRVMVEAYFDFKRLWTVALTSQPHTYSVGRKRVAGSHVPIFQCWNSQWKIGNIRKDMKGTKIRERLGTPKKQWGKRGPWSIEITIRLWNNKIKNWTTEYESGMESSQKPNNWNWWSLKKKGRMVGEIIWKQITVSPVLTCPFWISVCTRFQNCPGFGPKLFNVSTCLNISFPGIWIARLGPRGLPFGTEKRAHNWGLDDAFLRFTYKCIKTMMYLYVYHNVSVSQPDTLIGLWQSLTLVMSRCESCGDAKLWPN